jgi:hypothetical protein
MDVDNVFTYQKSVIRILFVFMAIHFSICGAGECAAAGYYQESCGAGIKSIIPE